jgi:hypothetical protein
MRRLMLAFILLHLLGLLAVVDALTNITIDDASSMIVYSSGWAKDEGHLNDLDYGGSLTRNGNDGRNAVFTFTGALSGGFASLHDLLFFQALLSTSCRRDGRTW